MTARSRIALLVAAVVALAAAAGGWWFLSRSAGPAPAVPAPASPVAIVNGITVVELKPSVQRASALQEQTVGPAAASESDTSAYGTVLDVQPLLDWRGKYAAAQAQDRSARVQWTVANAQLDRMRDLHADDQNASLKAVQAAQAEQERAAAAAQSAAAALRALQADALQQFGPVLAGWAQRRAAPIRQLTAHRASLVGIALDEAAPPATLQVSVGTGPRRTASWVGRAPRADARLGSGLQIYLVPAALPTNSSVLAWLRGPASTGGVFVPLSAAVWYADQPWAYVRRDASHFARVPLLQATEVPGGYVAHGGIAAGASVVTQGAGLLLSQEQTPPPNAAPCKDPECDD